jgi:hypothetical protein
MWDGLLADLVLAIHIAYVALRSSAGQPVSEATFIGRLMHYLLFVAVPGWMAQAIYIGLRS